MKDVQAEIRRLEARIKQLVKIPVPVKLKRTMIERIGLVLATDGVAIVTRKHVYTQETWKARKNCAKRLRDYHDNRTKVITKANSSTQGEAVPA